MMTVDRGKRKLVMIKTAMIFMILMMDNDDNDTENGVASRNECMKIWKYELSDEYVDKGKRRWKKRG